MQNCFCRRSHSERGFTLIELMVVVLIIGVLLAIAIPTFLGARSRSQDAVAKSNLGTAATSARAAIASGGDLSALDASAMAVIEGSLVYVDGSVESTGPKNVSVGGNSGAWGAATRSESGTCFTRLLSASGPDVSADDVDRCTADFVLGSSTSGGPNGGGGGPSGSGSAKELVVGGDFASPNVDAFFVTLSAGGSFGPWSVTAGSVDQIGNLWTPPSGGQSVDMSGNGPGAIAQTLPTTNGTKYKVQLLASINNYCGSASKRLIIKFGGSNVVDTMVAGPNAGDGSAWTTITGFGTATSTSTSLEIVSAEGSPCGPVVTAVSVIAT